MDIGVPLKVIYIPLPVEIPKQEPVREEPKEEPYLIPDWPIRVPVKEPADAGY